MREYTIEATITDETGMFVDYEFDGVSLLEVHGVCGDGKVYGEDEVDEALRIAEELVEKEAASWKWYYEKPRWRLSKVEYVIED